MSTFHLAPTPPVVYLARDATQFDALIEVSAAGTGADAAGTGSTEVIVVDCSSSMSGEKILRAREATRAAIGCVRDGVRFAVLAGTERATPVYPADGGLATATAQTRADAGVAVEELRAYGGTAIGRWVLAAAELCRTRPDSVRHALLLTDGQDVGETPAELDAAIDRSLGAMRCDCRGVGTDWVVAELRKIASALLGEVAVVAEPAGLTADFERVITAAMSRTLPDLWLRVISTRRSSVRLFAQVHPAVEDLTDRSASTRPRTSDFPTGSWGDETRVYRVGLTAQPGPDLLTRFALVGSAGTLATTELTVRWTDDRALTTRVNQDVEHFRRQTDLATVIQEGLAASRLGDTATAEAKLGRAVQLAALTGNTDKAALLRGIVEVHDETRGIVRLRPNASRDEVFLLDTTSTKTTLRGRPT